MWHIELNVAGHQFTHHVSDKRWNLFGVGGRTLPWRAIHFRHSRAD